MALSTTILMCGFAVCAACVTSGILLIYGSAVGLIVAGLMGIPLVAILYAFIHENFETDDISMRKI